MRNTCKGPSCSDTPSTKPRCWGDIGVEALKKEEKANEEGIYSVMNAMSSFLACFEVFLNLCFPHVFARDSFLVIGLVLLHHVCISSAL
jgi:hypothetical protein